jgi:hypothetical protein
MREAMNDLALMRLYVVHPGEKSFEMDDRIEAIGIEALPERFAAR